MKSGCNKLKNLSLDHVFEKLGKKAETTRLHAEGKETLFLYNALCLVGFVSEYKQLFFKNSFWQTLINSFTFEHILLNFRSGFTFLFSYFQNIIYKEVALRNSNM